MHCHNESAISLLPSLSIPQCNHDSAFILYYHSLPLKTLLKLIMVFHNMSLVALYINEILWVNLPHTFPSFQGE